MDSQLAEIINKIISKPDDIGTIYSYTLFDMIVTSILEYHDKPVNSLSEMKERRKKKTKGDLWEIFCKLYLQNIKKYDDVWLLSELPDNIRVFLGLKNRDFGIDIIARKNDKYTAVQCKFKKPRTGLVPGTWIPYNCVNWKELSTFYALCSKTNGNKWHQHIVMTNTKYVRHMGNKTYKDKSFCVGTFNKLSRMDLIELTKTKNNTIEHTIEHTIEYTINQQKQQQSIKQSKQQPTKQQPTKQVKKKSKSIEMNVDVNKLREARLKFFETNKNEN